MTARRPASPALPAKDSRRGPTGRASGWVSGLGPELVALVLSCVLGFAGLAGLALLTYAWPGSSGVSDSTDVVTAGAAGRGGALTLGDMDSIARAVANVRLVSRVVSDTEGVVLTDSVPRVDVKGVDPSFAQLPGTAVTRGVFFTDQDATAANRVAVLGQTVAASLFPNGQSPIGETIRIRNLPFTIIGVLAEAPGSAAPGQDNAVFVPFQTGQIRLFGTHSAYQILLQVRNPSQASAVTDQVQQLLRQRHQLLAGQPDDFTIQTGVPASAMGGTSLLQTVSQVLQVVQRYTCAAKSLCAISPST